MSKKQINSENNNQKSKYLDAKPAQKADHYEDFTDLAERLKKEGRLNEVSYQKLRRRFLVVNSFLALVVGLPILLAMGKNDDFLFFLLFGGLGIWGAIKYRLELNRYCYLFSLGKRTKARIVDVKKYEKNHYAMYYFMSLNKDAMYDYYIVFSFRDKNDELVTITQRDLKGLRPKKFYNVGDEVTVYCSLTNSRDVVIEPKETTFNSKYYNLLLI